MDKEFKNMDDLFRSELGGSVTEAPSFVKDRIDNALGFKRKRFGALLIVSLLVVLGITGGIVYQLTGDAETSRQALNWQQSNSSQRFQETTVALSESKHSPDINQESDHSSVITASSATSSPISAAAAQVNTTQSNPFDSDHSTEAPAGESKKGNLENGVQRKVIKQAVQPGSVDPMTAGETNPLNEISAVSEGDEPKEEPDPAPKNIQVAEKSKSEGSEVSEKSGTKESEITEKEEDVLADSKISPAESSIDPALQEPAISIEPPKPTYQPFMLSLSSGMNFSRTNYTSENMSEAYLYNTALNDAPGWQVNTDFTYRFKNGLTFGSGLGYSQFNEAYDYQLSKTEVETNSFYEYEYDYELIYSTYLTTTLGDTNEITVVEYVSDSVAYVTDSTLVTTTDTVVKDQSYSGNNRFSYVQIPFRLGTQMQFGKFQLDLFADTRLNFLTMSRGNLVEAGELKPFTAKDPVYRKFYVDVTLGTRLHYQLFGQLYANASIQYRPVMGNTYQTMSLGKSFDYFHAGLGLSWRF